MQQAKQPGPIQASGSIEPTSIYNILIVDDSEDDTFLLLREIKRNGLHVFTKRVDNDTELKATLKERDWHIVITDHNMPCYSSKEALHTVRTHDANVPVIIVSGEISDETAVQAMKDGAQDYVMKDNLARLIPAIEREIRESESRHAKRQAEENLEHLSCHDKLTGLVNRNEFERQLAAALKDSQRHNTHHILMYLDLDQFKIINDTCGHVAGDELIKQIAELVSRQIRNSDTLARLGGDEFGVLLKSSEKTHAIQLSNRIREEVKQHRFVWLERPFSISISLGMVQIDHNSIDVQELMSCADIACYAAKEKGRDTAKWYSHGDEQFDQLRSEMHWATKIKQAIEEDLFFLCQQPMLNLKNDQTNTQCEFLVRLRDNDEVVPPGLFIPAAERYHMMSSIDRWVVENVFRYLNDTGLGQKDTGTYFINLSGSSLSDDSFFSDIRKFLKQYNIIPNRICFEITETAAIANLNDAVEFIKEIREEGCKFALDDFGAGLSSFSYLKTIPVDYLKIDGSFVLNMIKDPIDEGIVKACNEIGHAAGLITIAEFVEDDATLAALKAINVDYAQGFGIARPEPI